MSILLCLMALNGKVSLAIIPCENSSYRAMIEGLDHVGFKVETLEEVKQELDELSQSHPDSSPKKIDLGRFGHVTIAARGLPPTKRLGR